MENIHITDDTQHTGFGPSLAATVSSDQEDSQGLTYSTPQANETELMAHVNTFGQSGGVAEMNTSAHAHNTYMATDPSTQPSLAQFAQFCLAAENATRGDTNCIIIPYINLSN